MHIRRVGVSKVRSRRSAQHASPQQLTSSMPQALQQMKGKEPSRPIAQIARLQTSTFSHLPGREESNRNLRSSSQGLPPPRSAVQRDQPRTKRPKPCVLGTFPCGAWVCRLLLPGPSRAFLSQFSFQALGNAHIVQVTKAPQEEGSGLFQQWTDPNPEIGSEASLPAGGAHSGTPDVSTAAA